MRWLLPMKGTNRPPSGNPGRYNRGEAIGVHQTPEAVGGSRHEMS